MHYKTHNEIKIKSPWNIIYIQKLELIVNPNEHAICRFKVVIPEEDSDKINNNLSDEAIELVFYENAKQKNIFYGYIEDIKLYKENEFTTLEVKAASATKKLDLKRNSKSFQDISMTYESLVEEVIKNKGNNIDAIFAEDSSRKTGIPIIQYAETDWNFLKRMASHFNTVIVPDLACNKSRFWFGIPEGTRHKLSQYEICNVCNDKDLFNKLSASKSDINESNCLSYTIKTGDNFEIGDNIEFNNTLLKVYNKHAELIEDLWTYTYKLVSEKVIFTKRHYNNKICGMSIIGEVIDTSGQRLKVHLDIDKEQKKSKAYWYDYTPQTGNSMYCMPKVGTNVSIYFRDEKEEHARAVSCVRNNGASCSKMSDYNNRSFATEHNKTMNLLPDKIDFISGDESNPLKLTLDDNAISFTSDTSLIMGADTDIKFTAGKNISLKAAGSVNIFLGNGESEPDYGVITVDIEINILGKKVKLIGEAEVGLPSIEDGLKRKEVDKKKLIGGILLGVAIACVVAAVAVVALPAAAAAIGVSFSLSSTAVFATVAVGGSIPVAIQAGKDIHNGESSGPGTYARIGFVGSLGTALALLPGGGIVEKLGVTSKIGQTVLGSGGAGFASAFLMGYLDNGLQGQLYHPSQDWINLTINTVGNMLPDVGEALRAGGKKTATEAAEEVAENLTSTGVKSTLRLTTSIDVKAVFKAYGIKFSNANINVLKKAIMKNPEAWINFVIQDKTMAKQVVSDPSLLAEVLENTIPILGANAATNTSTLGGWLYGDYTSYSY